MTDATIHIHKMTPIIIKTCFLFIKVTPNFSDSTFYLVLFLYHLVILIDALVLVTHLIFHF